MSPANDFRLAVGGVVGVRADETHDAYFFFNLFKNLTVGCTWLLIFLSGGRTDIHLAK